MSYVREMIQSHPQSVTQPKRDALIDAISACVDCAQACVSSADACLGEENPAMLRDVIRATNDNSDICFATARILSRLNNPPWSILKMQVESCRNSARNTGALCNEHARHHEHCRICSDSCRACENALTEYAKMIEQ